MAYGPTRPPLPKFIASSLSSRRIYRFLASSLRLRAARAAILREDRLHRDVAIRDLVAASKRRRHAAGRREGEGPGRPLLGFVLVLAVAVVAGFLWRQALTGERGGGRPAWNVLILTLDTTRAERLRPLGFAG